MASVDDRIVAMKFDNQAFEQKINSTIRSLDQLKKSLDFTNSAKGFQDLSVASDRFNLNGIANAVDGLASKFTTLGLIGITTLTNITNKAIDAGIQLGKSLSLDQVLSGFQEYQTNINSIQTILANTGSKGTTLEDVNASLDELNAYSDQTIYNFSQMAKNIGTFTAAGVDLNTSVGAIKGIANLAAISGSSAEQASTAMYQLSQAISTGTVRLIDWNSVSNAGIGGEVFQKALFETGKALGTINGITLDTTFEEWKKANGSFRDSLSGSGEEVVDTNTKIMQAQEEAAKVISEAEKDVADATENANQRVQDAKQRVQDAAVEGAEAIANASERQRRTIEDDANSIKEAWQDVIDARKRLDRAMQPASENELEAAQDRVTSSKLDQADLADAITRAEQQQTKALDRETKARQKLAQAQASGDLEAQNQAYFELQDAQNAVADAADAITRAELAQKSAARDVESAQESLTEVQKKGTAEDQNVIDAKKDLESAETRYAREIEDSAKRQKEAARDVAQAKEDSVRRQQDAARNLADVEEDRVKAIERAQDRLAKAHEDAAQRIVDSGGGVTDSWLTSDVLTTTLQAFTGDLDKAALVAMGYSEEQADQLVKLGELGKASATEVKTLTQLLSTVRENVGSGWATSFRSIFGTFEEAKKTFTDWNNQIKEVVDGSVDARQSILNDWAAMGGRDNLIKGITQAFKSLASILKPVKEAFRDIFPRKTGAELAKITERFLAFTKRLEASKETADTIRRIFKGVFAAFSIVGIIVKNVVRFFKELVGVFADTAGSPIVSVVGGIADGLVSINEKLKKGKGIEAFFDVLIAGAKKLATGIKFVVGFIVALVKGIVSGAVTIGGAIRDIIVKIGAFFSKLGGGLFGKIGELFGKVGDGAAKVATVVGGSALGGGLDYLGKAGQRLLDVWHGLVKILGKLKDGFVSFGKLVGRALGGIWDRIKEVFGEAQFSDVLDLVNVGLLGGLVVLFKKFADGGLFQTIFGKDFTRIFKDLFQGVTDTLSALQANIKAGTLVKIAGAIALLAASIILISLIDSAALTRSLIAISVGLGGLVAALAALDAIGGVDPKSTARLAGLAVVMGLIAGAILILSLSLLALSTLDAGQIATGLGAIAGITTALIVALERVSKFNGRQTFAAAIGIYAIAQALSRMADVVEQLGGLDNAELTRGLGGITALVGALILAFQKLPKDTDNKIKGMIGFSIALRIMASAVGMLGGLDAGTLTQGLAGLAGIMGGIVLLFGALAKLNVTQIGGLGPALLGLGLGLVAIGIAIALIGNLDFETLAKGLGTMAIVLTGMAVAVNAMSTGVAGAAAIAAVAVAFVLLAQAFKEFKDVGFAEIGKGLLAMVGVLAILAVMVGVLTAFPPAIPVMLAFGAALFLVGAGFALIGVGAEKMAKAVAIISKFGKDGVKIFKELLKAIINIIPDFIKGFAAGILELGETLIKLAPKLVEGLVKLVIQLLQGLRKILPELGKTVGELIDTFLQLLTEKGPDIIQAGLTFLLNFLKGIADNIAEITNAVVDIITGFLTELANRADDIITAGLDLLTSLAKGIADNIQVIIDAAFGIIKAFIQGMTNGITELTEDVKALVVAIGSAIVGVTVTIATQATRIIVAILNAMATAVKTSSAAVNGLIKAIVDAMISTTNTLATEVPRLVNAIFDAMVKATKEILDGVGRFIVAMCNSFSEAIDKHSDEIARAGGKLAASIVEAVVTSPWEFGKSFFKNIAGGIVGGIGGALQSAGGGLLSGIASVGSSLVGGFTSFLGINSPSKVFMKLSGAIPEGIVKGLTQDTSAEKGIQRFAGRINNAFSSTLASTAFDSIADINPTIAPVLDLTNVEREARRLGGMLSTAPVVASVSSSQASSLSAAERARIQANTQIDPTSSVKEIRFEQTINSPRELSTAAIYRQTKSQIALATQELTK